MPRNRIIYQSKVLFVSNTPATGAADGVTNQLHRIQTISDNVGIGRQDINQMGVLAAIGREIIDQPTVGLNFSYYLTNVLNEENLGLLTDGTATAISGFLDRTDDEKNYFVVVVPEGNDAVGYVPSTNAYTVGIGNGFLSSYSVEARVGGFATVTCGVQGLNLQAVTGIGGANPAVNPVNGIQVTGNVTIGTITTGVTGQATALRPGDVTITLTADDGGSEDPVAVDFSDAKIQAFTMSFDLNREPLQKLGSRFAFSREISFPVTVQGTVEANLGDLQTGNLADILCNDRNYTLTATIRKPSCTGDGAIAVIYELKAVKLDSEDFNSSIGPGDTVTLQYSTQLGGPQDTTRGLFISGVLV